MGWNFLIGGVRIEQAPTRGKNLATSKAPRIPDFTKMD